MLNIAIASVWLINGLYCKVLDGVPRHRLIVARILGDEPSFVLTKVIGVLEIAMCVWILSRIKPHLCAATQILLVAVMNTIEFILAPDLLLFGRANAAMAVLFISIIVWNEVLKSKEDPTGSCKSV